MTALFPAACHFRLYGKPPVSPKWRETRIIRKFTHHPTARQQDKTAFGFGKFDHFQLDAMLLGGFGRPIACIPLIDEGQFNRLARDLLDGLNPRVAQRDHSK
jgi:hypothetical protein